MSYRKKQLADSYKVLEAGSVQQLSNHQITCGVELGNMLVEAFLADKVPAVCRVPGHVCIHPASSAR